MFEFIETPFFSKALFQYLSDDEYAELQEHLNAHPNSGDVVPGSGGVRKMRWALAGRGKRGGLRVIYFYRSQQGEIWMITIYAKNVRENVPAHLLKAIKEAIENEENE